MIYSLNHNKETFFDPIDAGILFSYHWAYDTSNGYVYTKVRGKKLFLHRIILNAPKGLVVDHINNDRLDNRRKNLRLCSIKENVRKHGKMRRVTQSKYMGVCKFRKGWRAYIYFDNKQKSLGIYKTEKEAAKAYNQFASMKYGKNIILNKI